MEMEVVHKNCCEIKRASCLVPPSIVIIFFSFYKKEERKSPGEKLFTVESKDI